MKKKILMLLVAVLGMTSVAAARDTYSRDDSVLPKAAKAMIDKNFKAKVNVIKIDKDLGRIKEYEVILTDGTEITFDRNGNWDNVEVGLKGTIPSAFVPTAISNYVKKNLPDRKIVGIEKERNGFEVELDNGIDIKFNKAGEFVRYED